MRVKTAKKNRLIALVGKHLSNVLLNQKPDYRLRSRSQIKSAMSEPSVADWVVADREAADDLMEEAIIRGESIRPRKSLGNLILLEQPDFEILPPAQSLFKSISWAHSQSDWAISDLMHILRLPDPTTRIVGGMVNTRLQSLTVYRGDLRALTVALSIFKPTSSGLSIDPTRFAVGDGGNWICLGDYEASTEMVLYMADPDFRRRLNAKRKAEEKTFGASLRRLRKQKGLKQNDFGPIPERTIARIENGEITKPHATTLSTIARRLEVDAKTIGTY